MVGKEKRGMRGSSDKPRATEDFEEEKGPIEGVGESTVSEAEKSTNNTFFQLLSHTPAYRSYVPGAVP